VIIEEDTAMRALICEWLRDEGYDVLPRPVIGAGAEMDLNADLVIADLPNLRSRGAQAVREVRRRYPYSQVIGMSTQLDESLPGDSAIARSFGVRHLVAKPCSRDELIDVVSHAISPAVDAWERRR
jgi:DNA-binding response OmpR family regulator